MKSKIFQKSQKKSQNWPKKPKLAFFGKFKLFWNFFDFLGNLGFLGTSLLFVISEAT
jgi:hypothetical protein